jgi:hypothetical protein
MLISQYYTLLGAYNAILEADEVVDGDDFGMVSAVLAAIYLIS